MSSLWNVIGCLAAVCGAISLIPEVLKALKTHHLGDVSWGMLFLLMLSSIMWGSYGVSQNDLPLIASAIINFTLETVLIALKKHYTTTGKPLFEHWKEQTAKRNQLELVLENESSENHESDLEDEPIIQTDKTTEN